jgi:hypothetical protein
MVRTVLARLNNHCHCFIDNTTLLGALQKTWSKNYHMRGRGTSNPLLADWFLDLCEKQNYNYQNKNVTNRGVVTIWILASIFHYFGEQTETKATIHWQRRTTLTQLLSECRAVGRQKSFFV